MSKKAHRRPCWLRPCRQLTQDVFVLSRFGQDKKDLLPELIKNGVRCEVRKLQVGDFLWVARDKAHSLPGEYGRFPMGSSREGTQCSR